MYILLLIFFIIFLIQFALGIYSWYLKRRMSSRYAFILGDMVEPATTLENYIKIYRKLNLRVNADIDKPAYAEENFLLVSKRKMYSPDLFTNYYLLFQLELTKKKYNLFRNFGSYQNILFIAQFIFFFLGLSSIGYSSLLLALSIGLEALLIILSLILFLNLSRILKIVHDTAKDLLNLDNVEEARAEALREDLNYVVFEYPFDIGWKLLNFFKP